MQSVLPSCSSALPSRINDLYAMLKACLFHDHEHSATDGLIDQSPRLSAAHECSPNLQRPRISLQAAADLDETCKQSVLLACTVSALNTYLEL